MALVEDFSQLVVDFRSSCYHSFDFINTELRLMSLPRCW